MICRMNKTQRVALKEYINAVAELKAISDVASHPAWSAHCYRLKMKVLEAEQKFDEAFKNEFEPEDEHDHF